MILGARDTDTEAEISALRLFLDRYRVDVICDDESVTFMMGKTQLSKAKRLAVGDIVREHGPAAVLNGLWGPVFHALTKASESSIKWAREADETFDDLQKANAEIARLEDLVVDAARKIRNEDGARHEAASILAGTLNKIDDALKAAGYVESTELRRVLDVLDVIKTLRAKD